MDQFLSPLSEWRGKKGKGRFFFFFVFLSHTAWVTTQAKYKPSTKCYERNAVGLINNASVANQAKRRHAYVELLEEEHGPRPLTSSNPGWLQWRTTAYSSYSGKCYAFLHECATNLLPSLPYNGSDSEKIKLEIIVF